MKMPPFSKCVNPTCQAVRPESLDTICWRSVAGKGDTLVAGAAGTLFSWFPTYGSPFSHSVIYR